MKKSIVLFFISLILVSLTSISAQSPDRTPWCFWNNYSSRLNLTSEQKVRLENFYQSFLEAIYPIQSQLTSKFFELRRLYLNSPVNKTTITTKQKELFALQQKIQEKILDYRLEVLDILTTQQILLLPSDCCLGINLGRGYGMGFGRGFGYGRGFGRGRRGRGMNFYFGRGTGRSIRRNAGYHPFWWR